MQFTCKKQVDLPASTRQVPRAEQPIFFWNRVNFEGFTNDLKGNRINFEGFTIDLKQMVTLVKLFDTG